MRKLIMLPLALALTVIPMVAGSPSAAAATGSFEVYGFDAEREESSSTRLDDPADCACHNTGVVGTTDIDNNTNALVVIYRFSGCTGDRLVMQPGETRSETKGNLPGWDLSSAKFLTV
ncbi:hypothetical protein [Streptomyces sp. FIT100]|uniref:hypothetical protein n=1 Tax=Streptomyces sp. FIT100 TaxID=2837956 RepID=UPI0021C583A1|nr:hypothetical protein [Streptomyces sp. FIT100]UUN28086.1 hypothetical protein KK483_18115 [Streptomyces sp. FIT100]